MAAKIFVFGDLNGQLQAAFGKLATLHAKNNFSFAIAAGNLFAKDNDEAVADLLDGKINIPVATYFTVGTRGLPPRIAEKVEKEEDVCVNLHFLSRRAIHKTSEGVRIVTLGGVWDSTSAGGISEEQHLPYHTLADAKVLRGANSADILLTAAWPTRVWNGSQVALPDSSSIAGSDAVVDLVKSIKPRYHLTTSPASFSFEREPFFHPPKEEGLADIAVTRFISLAAFGNAEKAKSMYAFSLSPETITSIPPGSTVTPFPETTSRKRQAPQSEEYSRFGNGHHDGNYRRKRHRAERSPPPGPDRCFLCLSNSNFASHMVCSIGEESFLATAKGPLPSPQTWAQYGLNFPAHFMVTPLIHAPTLTTAAMGESAPVTFAEMARFRESLQAMVSTVSKQKLGGVTWEISRTRNIHHHWQFMPVPAAMLKKGLVEAAFRVEAENEKLPKLEVKDFDTADAVEGDYFRVWIWAEEDGDDGGRIISKCLLLRFDENVRFNLQYGRNVMAKLLGLEKRKVWQDVEQTEEEETADKEVVREVFKDWDFTLLESGK